MEWKDISTAPKDGTGIFIWNEKWKLSPIAEWYYFTAIESHAGDCNCWGWAIDEAVDLGQHEDGALVYEDDPMPTHWDYVRTPPKQEVNT